MSALVVNRHPCSVRTKVNTASARDTPDFDCSNEVGTSRRGKFPIGSRAQNRGLEHGCTRVLPLKLYTCPCLTVPQSAYVPARTTRGSL